MEVWGKIQPTSPVLNPGDGAEGWFLDSFLLCFEIEVSKEGLFECFVDSVQQGFVGGAPESEGKG